MSGFRSDRVRSNDGSYTLSELNRQAEQARDAQPLLTRCGHCGDEREGTFTDGHAWWLAHMATHHPQVRLRKRGRRSQRDAAMVVVAERVARRAA